MGNIPKLTVAEILELYEQCESHYGKVFELFKADQKYYELDFYDLLNLPEGFEAEGIVLPSGRDFVDSCVDNTSLKNVKVFLNKFGTKAIQEKSFEMLRKFYLGLLHITEVENTVSPWQMSKKHFWLHGLSVIKHVWDADRWLDKPERKEDEPENDYAERIDEWRSMHHQSIPIVIKALNPCWVMPDPFEEGGQFVFETQERLVYNVKNKYPGWSNPEGKKLGDKVKHISFWTDTYRCELYDNEPVLRVKSGVAKHNYGFVPYTFIESGLGNISFDNDPAMRYVGVLRYVRESLVSESRNYSMSDIVLKHTAMPGGTIVGHNSRQQGPIKIKFGEFQPLPDDTKLEPWPIITPTSVLMEHLALIYGRLAAHAAPNATRGLPEPGVRSAIHFQEMATVAGKRFSYAEQAYQNGVAKTLTNCAKIVKNVIPGDFKMWARTPTDEIDVEIKKELMREPFTCYVQFSPVDEEDEYRRQQARLLMVKEDIVSKKWARQQMNNVDPEAMEVELEVERLMQDPNVQGLLSQYVSGKLMEALAKRSAGESVDNPQLQMLGAAMGQGESLRSHQVTSSASPVMPTQTTTPMQQMNAPGSAGQIDNQMEQQRRAMGSGSLQGIGGGGNRH